MHRTLTACICLALPEISCTEEFPFWTQASIDVGHWAIIDRGDATGIRIHDLTSHQSYETLYVDQLVGGDRVIDISATDSGLLAATLGLYASSRATKGERLAIMALPEGTILRTRDSVGLFVAWSNAADRLALVDVDDAEQVVILSVLDAELNTLMSRSLPLSADLFNISAYHISWSADDSLVAVSAAVEESEGSLGIVRLNDTGAIVSSLDSGSEVISIPYSTVYFVGNDLLVGTSHSEPRGLFTHDGIVYKVSLSGNSIDGIERVPEAAAVASSCPVSGVFLTQLPRTLPTTSVNTELRLRDIRGGRSEIIGRVYFGDGLFGNRPTKLAPRHVSSQGPQRKRHNPVGPRRGGRTNAHCLPG